MYRLLLVLWALFSLTIAEYGDDMKLTECSCLTYLEENGLRWSEENLVAQIDVTDDVPPRTDCTRAGTGFCEDICYLRMKYVTNNYDLSKQPIGVKTAEAVSLGQHFCNIIGRNVDRKYLGLGVHFACVGDSVRREKTSRLHSVEKARLTCEFGRFLKDEADQEHFDETNDFFGF